MEERLQSRAQNAKKGSKQSHIRLGDSNQFKIDSSKLRELEKRLTNEEPKANNDYLHDLAFTNEGLSR